MANRCLLHISRLEAFKAWLVENYIGFREGKGDYEVLQVQLLDGWYKIYRKNYMPEHYVVQDKLEGIVRRFITHEKEKE